MIPYHHYGAPLGGTWGIKLYIPTIKPYTTITEYHGKISTTSLVNYSTLYQLTIFLSPDSDHSTGGSLTNSHRYNGAVVCIVGMKWSNGGLRHIRRRWDLKCVAHLKFTNSNSVLSEFSKLLICRRRVPVKINVSRVESNSTSVRRSANRVWENTTKTIIMSNTTL